MARRPGRPPNGWTTSGTSYKWLDNIRDVIRMAGQSPNLYMRKSEKDKERENLPHLPTPP